MIDHAKRVKIKHLLEVLAAEALKNVAYDNRISILKTHLELAEVVGEENINRYLSSARRLQYKALCVNLYTHMMLHPKKENDGMDTTGQ